MRTLAQFKGVEESLGLFQDFVDEYKTFFILKVEHGVLVMTVGFQSGGFQFENYGQPIFDSCFMKFVFRVSGVIKL